MTELTNHTPIPQVLKQDPASMSDDYLTHFFYDWFCKDEALPAKSRKLLGKLQAISPSARFNPETTYTFFKNNCPANGSLYDDFRVCDIKTGDVIFCVVPYCGHDSTRGDAEVWGKDTDGEFKTLVRGSWKDVKSFFKMTDSAWAAHKAKLPVSPFQVGVEVILHGEHRSYGELPKKHTITQVSEQGTFRLEDNDYRWFKRDGTFSQKVRRSRPRFYRVELWSDYCATQKAEDERKHRQNICETLRREIENGLYRIDRTGSEESLQKLTTLRDLLNQLAPAPVKNVA